MKDEQPPAWAKRPRLSRNELLAMSRMLRLHEQKDRFFNPLEAMDTQRLAMSAVQKIEAWRRG